MHRLQFLPSICLVVWALLFETPTIALDLEIRARVGPWPAISQVIGYRGRVWFANSVKGRNHNSADLWSLDPATGDLRYERHLYSQDAGVPLVHRGLLYWPFEDSRFSLGWGMIQVTDGKTWQPLLVPSAQIFHSDSLVSWRDEMLLVTSAWRTGFQLSDNLGRDWTQLYDHPTPSRRISRFYDPVLLRGELYGYLKDTEGIRLVQFADGRLNAVPGWPQDRYFFGLTNHRNHLYAAIRTDSAHRLWRTDGKSTTPVGENSLPAGIVDLASDGNQLWAVSRNGNIWSSPAGGQWTRAATLSGGRPLSLHIVAGKIYAAGAGEDGRGILWGPSSHRLPATEPATALPAPKSSRGTGIDWQRRGAELDAALADPLQYRNHARGRIRTLIHQAVRDRPPPGFFAARLKAVPAAGTVQAFGGGMTVRVADLSRTILLWAMGLTRQPEVPVDLLARPWTAPPNDFEKYFDPQPAALWAVAAAGQRDTATLDALIARLDEPNDPLWLRSQVVGALTALTGHRFAYDFAEWKRWWRRARATWND